MSTSVEREKVESVGEVPTEVREVSTTHEIPEHVEKAGVTAVPSDFTAQVADDQGQPLTQSPPQKVINVPSDTQTLQTQAKGSVADSVTWLALFWLRIIKKAAHFGWSVVVGKKQ